MLEIFVLPMQIVGFMLGSMCWNCHTIGWNENHVLWVLSKGIPDSFDGTPLNQ